MNDPSATFWERGYRCHAFRLGEEYLGFVSIPPRGLDGIGGAKNGYHWSFEPDCTKGKATTLRQAKRIIEKKYRNSR